jgi:hypothetical protein
MADTFVKIASVTVGAGGTSSIDFSSIPSTYTDLVIYHSCRINDASNAADMNIQFNADTGANYSFRRLTGDGSAAASSSGSSNALFYLAGLGTGTTATANTFGNTMVYIPNYTLSNQKSGSYDGTSENNGTAGFDHLGAVIYTGTSAITAIKLRAYSGNTILQYSTATLYGILKA